MKRIWPANEGRRTGQRGAGQESAPALRAQHRMILSRVTGFQGSSCDWMMASAAPRAVARSDLDFAVGFGREDRRTLACHDLSRPGGQGQAMPVRRRWYAKSKAKAATQIGYMSA